MWVRFSEDELAALKRILTNAACSNELLEVEARLNFYENAKNERFRKAVPTNTELEVDEDAVVSESDEGAFVMCWAWVSNDAAGIETENEDE